MIDRELIDRCAVTAIAAGRPVDDRPASAWYRKEAGTMLVAGALARAAGLDMCEEVKKRKDWKKKINII